MSVLVIGAGPAGSVVANELARGGVSVKLYEEHEKPGTPDHCAGLISVRGLLRTGYPPPSNAILNVVDGALFNFGKIKAFIRGRKAWVLDRSAYDYWLAEMASSNGVELIHERVKSLYMTSGRVKGIYVKSHVEAGLVIDAEGATRKLARQAGVNFNIRYAIPGVQLDARLRHDSDYVELHFDERIAPGFFAWIIPLDEQNVRIGLGAKTHGLERLKIFAKRINARDLRNPRGGIIWTGGFVKMLARDMILVGDAAGHVKPTTGGGVVLGETCAKIAAKCILDGDPYRYPYECKKKIGRDMRIMKLTSKIMFNLPARLLGILSLFVGWKRLEKIADMDFQGSALSRILSLREIFANLRKLFRGVENV